MVSVKVASLVGAAVAVFAGAAQAADMPGLPPIYAPPIEEYSPSPSGWYLRGDIGMTNQQVDASVSAFSAGTGRSRRLRLGQRPAVRPRPRLQDQRLVPRRRDRRVPRQDRLHGSDLTVFNGGTGVDNYSGTKSEWVFLANAYFDLGTWWCVTPYIGAGVGMADIMMKGFRDDGFTYIGGVLNNSTAYAEDASKWNFAWAVQPASPTR